jgi:ankyrin repeat protein
MTNIKFDAFICWLSFQYLLEKGADPTQVNSVTGDSVLTTVAASGRKDCVHLLLQDGRVDLGHRNKAGLSAVHVAAAMGHIEVLKVMSGHCCG